jgi:hypothetical protein
MDCQRHIRKRIHRQRAKFLARRKKVKFGDLVANDYTGSDNPYHVLMVVTVTNDFIDCVSDDGRIHRFVKKMHDMKFIRSVGSVDLSAWKIAKNTEQANQPENGLPVCWNENCPKWSEDICQSPGKCIEDVSG